MSVLKQRAFFCDAIKGRSFYDRITVGSGVRPAPVIGDAEQDVGTIFGGDLGGDYGTAAIGDAVLERL